MRIDRHQVEQTGYRASFESNVATLKQSVQGVRSQASNLGLLAQGTITMAQIGSLFETDSLRMAGILRVAAQAFTAAFACPRPDSPARPVRIGDGPLVIYDQQAPKFYTTATPWSTAFMLSILTRQRELLDILLAVPPNLLRLSAPEGYEDRYYWSELWRAIGQSKPVIGHSAYEWLRRFVDSCTSRSDVDVRVRELDGPHLDLFAPLEEKNERQFETVLAEALKRHRKYWGATAKRRQDRSGWVSIRLTATAALAYDRGLRFDVQSDYMPQSWVTGEVFRQTPPAM